MTKRHLSARASPSMLEWAPDEAVRKKIFADNPAELFVFGKAT